MSMTANRFHGRYAFISVATVLFLPATMVSQDTIRVRMPGSSVFENGSLASDLSRIVINRLVKGTEYVVLPLQSNAETVDLIGLAEIDTRATPEGFTRSEAVFNSCNVIIATNAKNVNSLAELDDARVGVLASSLGEERIRRETQLFETYSTPERLVSDLLKGKIEYALVEASLANVILGNDGTKGQIHIVNRSVFESRLGFFVRSGNDRLLKYLNEHIGTFEASGGPQDLAARFINVPKDYSALILVIALLIGGIAIVALVLIGWNRKWIPRLANSYSVQLSGLLMIRPSPTMHTGAPAEQSNPDFKDKFSAFQTKYPSIDSRLEFHNPAVRIEFRSTNRTRVGGKEFLDTFARDLEDLISPFAPERYVMELNVTGECSSMLELNRFAMTNNRGRVGVVVSAFRKKMFF